MDTKFEIDQQKRSADRRYELLPVLYSSLDSFCEVLNFERSYFFMKSSPMTMMLLGALQDKRSYYRSDEYQVFQSLDASSTTIVLSPLR